MLKSALGNSEKLQKTSYSLIPADFHLDFQRCQKIRICRTKPPTFTRCIVVWIPCSTLLFRSLWKKHFNNYFVWEKCVEGFSVTLFLGSIILFSLFYPLDVNCLQLLSFVKHLGWLWMLNNGEHSLYSTNWLWNSSWTGYYVLLRPYSGKIHTV